MKKRYVCGAECKKEGETCRDELRLIKAGLVTKITTYIKMVLKYAAIIILHKTMAYSLK